MPEWPEMENYRRLLLDKVSGARIIGTEVTCEKSINVAPDVFAREITGAVVWFVEHRGKFLILHLDNGKRLVLHLMLGGLLYFGNDEDRPDRTVQVTIRLISGNLYFIGLRLGYLHLLTAKDTNAAMAELGPEPFDKRLDAQRFRERFAGKRGKLKPALTDQAVIAGIGNCYADEICFTAGVHPAAAIPKIAPEAWERLYAAMRTVLEKATDAGGYMEMPLYAGDTLTGGYNERCLVYDRGGEPCPRCESKIVQTETAGRKMFYCPVCQPEA